MQRTALLSVFYKTGITDFARTLVEMGWKIISSGGTARHLDAAGIPVTDVAKITGMPPILGHRVVTLHPMVHGALMALDTPDHRTEREKYGIPWIDLLCVDLYPLEEEIAKSGATLESVIEKTDVGGPSMLHSAAKGRRIVVCDPADRQPVLDWLAQDEPDREQMISRLVAKAEAVGANYLLASARYHSNGDYDGVVGRLSKQLKYGENPHQTPAGLFVGGPDHPLALHHFEQVHGKDLGFVNYTDLDRLVLTMIRTAQVFNANEGSVPYIAVGVKHGNASGVGVSDIPTAALERMLSGNLEDIFGGIIMTNFEIGPDEARTIMCYHMEGDTIRFLNGIIAPSFATRGLSLLGTRQSNRCLVNQQLVQAHEYGFDATRFRPVLGGFLRQPMSRFVFSYNGEYVELNGALSSQQRTDLLLARAVGETSTSNTITLAKGTMLIGSGVGQKSRVRAAKLAVEIAHDAGHDTMGAVAYSDSFFPFRDGVEVLANAGITAIMTSSGSKNDDDVRACCAEQGITLLMVPDKLGRGFFGH